MALALLAAVAILPGTAQAQASNYPNRTITVVVPFAAGGFTDVLARLVARHMSEKFKQPVVVENRAGAAGAIAANYVAAAPPDGYTLMFASASQISVAPLWQKVTYDPAAFTPVAIFGTIPFLMGIKASLPAKTVAEFAAYGKTNAGKLNYATAGQGSTSHLIGAGFASISGVEMVHVPFKGSAPAAAALMQGTVDTTFSGVSDLAPQMTNPALRIIAISSKERLPSLPDIPTIAETFPGFAVETWNGFVAPPGTPREIADKVSQATIEAAKSPDIAKRLLDLGIAAKATTPDEMAAVIQSDKATYGAILKAAGMIPAPTN